MQAQYPAVKSNTSRVHLALLLDVDNEIGQHMDGFYLPPYDHSRLDLERMP